MCGVYIVEHLFVQKPYSITIQPGTVVKFDSGGYILLDGSTLTAQGTPAQPIIFTSINDDAAGNEDSNGNGPSTPLPGDWRSISLVGTSGIPGAGVLDLEYAVVRYGGGTCPQHGMISNQAANSCTSANNPPLIRINHSRLEGSSSAGILLNNLRSGSFIANSSVVGHVGIGISTTVPIIAENNWWGSESGPASNGEACNSATGAGEEVSCFVDFDPWLHCFDPSAIGHIDSDGDNWENSCDNCPTISNSTQADAETDTRGDACDNCPDIANESQLNTDSDTQGDACEHANCTGVATVWSSPTGDSDCDGFPNAAPQTWREPVTLMPTSRADETFVGTLPNVKCASTAAMNDEPGTDAWPVDFNDDQRANTLDIGQYVGKLNSLAPGPPYTARLDLDGNARLNTLDVGRFVPFLNKVCSP